MSAPGRWSIADSVRLVAVALLLAQGAIHLQQYEGPISAVPTINTLFVLNAVGASSRSCSPARAGWAHSSPRSRASG